MIQEENYCRLGGGFFEGRAIRKIRKMAGGDTYVVIYIKMLILAAENDGKIISEGIGVPLDEEISLALNEPAENVGAALYILEGCGLIERVGSSEILFRQQMKGEIPA